ncbi:MAG: DUF1800 domain-containing protein [Flavobacteriales bacterium]|nr:DUF1800 domain-containing protein [Flavobacteriales bacterium]
MRAGFVFFLLLLISFKSYSQIEIYEDYVGGGHSEGILVSASSSFSDPDWSDNSSPEHTINAEGLDGSKVEAARFLYQACLGGTSDQIDQLAKTLDFEAWIDNQISIQPTNFLNLTRQAYEIAHDRHKELYGNSAEYAYNEVHFQYAWWEAAMTKSDVFRQRVAFALSQIFVISTDSDIRNDGEGPASYYDMLMKHAFGNYRELLEEVTYHPSMGIYLSHFKNRATDEEQKIYPDENFAREIMQLFSIGLFELNIDGTLKTDQNGNSIPTYDAEDIRNLAKVMTGLGAGALTDEAQSGHTLGFLSSANLLEYTVPMVMYDDFHEKGTKIILGDKEIPNGQTGEEDVSMALDYLFNHPNTAPFVSRRLIQQLVKSNPSPRYIEDIANVFNHNGDGVRGDLGAVIKAILLHDEARSCAWKEEPTNGKLKSPVGRYLSFLRQYIDRENTTAYWTSGYIFENETYQLPLSSPSVFNFFLPDYQPNGDIFNAGLYAPEFEIYNSVTSLGFANQADIWVRQARLFSLFDLELTAPLGGAYLAEMAKDSEVLVNEMNLRLCNGDMSEGTHEIITSAINEMNFGQNRIKNKVEYALYLTLISPDFAIQK